MADQQWRVKAKKYIEWVQKQVSKEEDFLKSFLNTLNEIAPENGECSREAVKR